MRHRRHPAGHGARPNAPETRGKRSILVPSTGGEADLAVFGAALSVCRAFQAHLDVLHVRLDVVDVAFNAASASGGTVLVESLVEQLKREVQDHQTDAKRLFDEFCSNAGLEIAEAPAEGVPERPT